MNKKLLTTLLVILWALYAIGNASLILNFPDLTMTAIGNKYSFIQFAGPGNNFVWSTFRLSTSSTSGQTITLNGATKTCSKEIRGLYFNSQRGKRLRPLDQNTLGLLRQQNASYNDLSMTGWLYTTCSGNNYSIFGAITYTRLGQTTHVVAGTKIDFDNNKITNQFADSFQYFDNAVPLWYIYDSAWGIGFVGGELTSPGGDVAIGNRNLINFLNNWGIINSGFEYNWNTIIEATAHRSERKLNISSANNALETMWNMVIQGSVGLSKTINETERLSFLGNIRNKAVIYNAGDINSSTIINAAKQKAQQLCQGKTNYAPIVATRLSTTVSSDKNVICVQDQTLTIDLTQEDTYRNKTIIVTNGNVQLEGGMNADSPSLDLFIDKWLLYLPDPITSQTFAGEGFPSTPWTTAWLYLKGNFVLNGLIAGKGWTPFIHKLHIQGKITLLNTPIAPTEGKIKQIENMFPSLNDTGINLQNIFTRQCGLGGTGSDGTSCWTDGDVSWTPLVIVNGNYPSKILQ